MILQTCESRSKQYFLLAAASWISGREGWDRRRGQKASGTIASIKHPLQREFLACGFFFLQEGRVGEISRNVILENTGYLSCFFLLPSVRRLPDIPGLNPIGFQQGATLKE